MKGDKFKLEVSGVLRTNLLDDGESPAGVARALAQELNRILERWDVQGKIKIKAVAE